MAPRPGVAPKLSSGKVMLKGPFQDVWQEIDWWNQLPAAPAMTVLLLRQQNRRRWSPHTVALMLEWPPWDPGGTL